jgi:tRNA(Ile)-lysidine synthetase-like protein
MTRPRSTSEHAITVPVLDLAALVRHSVPRGRSAVLAVSGGLDSMALLDAAAAMRKRRGYTLIVATYDHASGAHSARAASFVARQALAYGLPVVVGRSDRSEATEAGWRAVRWQFLQSVAHSTSGVVLTAHTRDDQVETVLMRAMRGAGARGLAGLRAQSDVRRPFVNVRRAELRAYADARSLTWLEDPTNRSRGYLRNRIRLDLLPALFRVRPTLDADLIEIGDHAAMWRSDLAALVESSIRFEVGRDTRGFVTLDVTADDIASYSRAELSIVWPELASRAGITLDGRGTRRAAELTASGQAGNRIQVSGGWQLVRSRDRFELRTISTGDEDGQVRSFAAPMIWDRWSFTPAEVTSTFDAWSAALPCEGSLWIRAWRPGDRLTIRYGDRLIARKVKYLLSDAGISGHIRARWPVVLAGDEIVWIPGVRRSDAATARSGGPVVIYVCDYLDRRP